MHDSGTKPLKWQCLGGNSSECTIFSVCNQEAVLNGVREGRITAGSRSVPCGVESAGSASSQPACFKTERHARGCLEQTCDRVWPTRKEEIRVPRRSGLPQQDRIQWKLCLTFRQRQSQRTRVSVLWRTPPSLGSVHQEPRHGGQAYL